MIKNIVLSVAIASVCTVNVRANGAAPSSTNTAAQPSSSSKSARSASHKRRDAQIREAMDYKGSMRAARISQAPAYVQYIAGGEQYHVKGDDATAKRYWYQALSMVEKSKPTKMNGAIDMLERKLKSCYPEDWSKSQLDLESRLKLQQEEAALMTRLVRLDSQAPETPLKTAMVSQNYLKALKDIEVTKGAMRAQQTAKTAQAQAAKSPDSSNQSGSADKTQKSASTGDTE